MVLKADWSPIIPADSTSFSSDLLLSQTLLGCDPGPKLPNILDVARLTSGATPKAGGILKCSAMSPSSQQRWLWDPLCLLRRWKVLPSPPHAPSPVHWPGIRSSLGGPGWFREYVNWPVRKQDWEVPATLSPTRKPDSAAGSWTWKAMTERRNWGWQGRKGSHIVPGGFTLSPDGGPSPHSLPSQRRKKGAVWAGFSPFNNLFLSGNSLHNEGGAGQRADPRQQGSAKATQGQWGWPATAWPLLVSGGQASFGNSAVKDWGLRQPASIWEAGNVFGKACKFLKDLGWSSIGEAVTCG